MKEDNCRNIFSQTLLIAIEQLKSRSLDSAYNLIKNALFVNPDAPEPHNLLGILAELKGDDSIARKHYRAAYALDPTYKPACRNLERLVVFEWGPQRRDYDFGDIQTESVGAMKEDIKNEGNR